MVGVRIGINSERESGWGFMSFLCEYEVGFFEVLGRVERNLELYKLESYIEFFWMEED